MAETNEEMTLDEIFNNINDIIEDLEDNDIEIEQAFAKYETGMKLLAQANGQIDVIEKKVQALNSDGETEDFE